jgi:hypothetical protein
MSKQDKFGKKKSGNKFDRNKVYASSEADIVLANQSQEAYKEIRGKERHDRRVHAGLEDEVVEKVDINENVDVIEKDEPINKYDIKRYGTAEEAEKYLCSCHSCGKSVPKGTEFCNEKCKEYVSTYGYSCKWGADCKMCKLSKKNKVDRKVDDEDYE